MGWHWKRRLCMSGFSLPLGSRPVQTQLSPAPAQLLRHLRSLTKTDAMDVFLKFGPVSTHLDTIRQRGSLQQPRLNLDAMYGRGVRGGINAWEHYLYNESDLPSDAWNPFLDKDPPPYEDVIAMGQKSPDPPPEPLYRASADGEEIGWRAQGSTSPLLVQGIETYAYAPRGQKRKATSPPQVVWNDGTTEEDPSPPPHPSHSIVVDAISATCEAKDILRRRGDVSDWSLLKKPQLLLELQEWLIQAWQDGNKRAALIATDTFLKLNASIGSTGFRFQLRRSRGGACESCDWILVGHGVGAILRNHRDSFYWDRSCAILPWG